MTNRGTNHRHGGHQINERRCKSIMSRRRNKDIATEKREKLRALGLNC